MKKVNKQCLTLRTDRRTDGWTHGQRENSIPHHKQSLRGGGGGGGGGGIMSLDIANNVFVYN